MSTDNFTLVFEIKLHFKSDTTELKIQFQDCQFLYKSKILLPGINK